MFVLHFGASQITIIITKAVILHRLTCYSELSEKYSVRFGLAFLGQLPKFSILTGFITDTPLSLVPVEYFWTSVFVIHSCIKLLAYSDYLNFPPKCLQSIRLFYRKIRCILILLLVIMTLRISEGTKYKNIPVFQ